MWRALAIVALLAQSSGCLTYSLMQDKDDPKVYAALAGVSVGVSALFAIPEPDPSDEYAPVTGSYPVRYAKAQVILIGADLLFYCIGYLVTLESD